LITFKFKMSMAYQTKTKLQFVTENTCKWNMYLNSWTLRV
jgi:hypothetical protein